MLPDQMRSKIVRFRLQGQHLSHRLPPGELLQAAGACGVQNTPPSAAALSLHARLSGLTRDAVEQALEEGKTLLQTWSLRGAPTIFPTRDAAVFNTGLLPGNSRTLQTFIIGSEQPLKELGMPVGELVRLTAEAARVVLDGRILANKWKLDQELAQHILHKLPAEQQKIWQGPSPFAENQILGEALVSFALRPVALQGVICFAPRRGNEASFVFTEQWLGSPPAALDLRQARRELLRRYLRCYGPSTPQDFAAWTGTALQQAKETWDLVKGELVEVNLEGRRAWLHAEHLPDWDAPDEPQGVRFLPPHDPYMQQRDRQVLAADKKLQRTIWRTVGRPGVVLLDGEIAAVWRPEKRGRRQKLNVTPIVTLAQPARSLFEAEAQTLVAVYPNCDEVQVEFVDD